MYFHNMSLCSSGLIIFASLTSLFEIQKTEPKGFSIYQTKCVCEPVWYAGSRTNDTLDGSGRLQLITSLTP